MRVDGRDVLGTWLILELVSEFEKGIGHCVRKLIVAEFVGEKSEQTVETGRFMRRFVLLFMRLFVLAAKQSIDHDQLSGVQPLDVSRDHIDLFIRQVDGLSLAFVPMRPFAACLEEV